MSGMRTVQLRFFASVREQLNCGELTLQVAPQVATLGQLREMLCERDPRWAEVLATTRPLRMAYQQTMCDAGQQFDDTTTTHEVAFFPPVTGG